MKVEIKHNFGEDGIVNISLEGDVLAVDRILDILLNAEKLGFNNFE